MKRLIKSQRNIIILDIVIFLFCILGIYNVFNKSALPLSIENQNSNLVITGIEGMEPQFEVGDKIISIDNLSLESKEEIEMFLDGKSHEDSVEIKVERNEQISILTLKLKLFYSLAYLIIASLVGTLFFIVAIIVLIKCEKVILRNSFHWAFIFTGMIILMTWGNYSLLPLNLGTVTRVGFHVGYLFAPVFFLKFSLVFPSEFNFIESRIVKLLNIAAILLVTALSLIFYLFVKINTLDLMRLYISIFDISSLFIVLVTLSAISVFIRTYITTSNETDRKKIRWIIIGFILGPLSYLVFWVIPFRIWNQTIIPEEAVLLLIAFVPITFGISIVKYRLMNVDIIFRRGIVYSAVITVLLLVYLIILSLLTTLVNFTNSQTVSIMAAISIALLFQPVKTWMQKVVDRKFFRIKYDYRIALKLFNREIDGIYNSKELTQVIIEFIENQIPVSKIGVLITNPKCNEIELASHKNFEKISDKNFQVSLKNSLSDNTSPIACSDHIDLEASVTKTSFEEFKKLEIDLIFKINSSKNESLGFVILGEKKSQSTFTAEDIDLINTVVSRFALSLDRIKLQEEVIRERLETERLEELNKLKTYFVSSVSHDLKTPLTSIKLFAERLKTAKDLSLEKKNDYLEIIIGESERLTRLINNVLDFSKIEREIQQYTFRKANIVEIVKSVLTTMEYQIKINKFDITAEYEANNLTVNIDADALSEALINILSNSLKYYSHKKVINISVKTDDNYAIIDVEDKGKGIHAEDLTSIFEPFFRSKKMEIASEGGAGLGLTIVKNIMDAHKGIIDITSKINIGTKVSLKFPLEK